MKKIFLKIFLITTFVLSMCAISVDAATYGQYEYVIKDDTVTITGVLSKAFFENSQSIPDKIKGLAVVSIGDAAFSGCGNLTGITIPEGVTSIGKSAFSSCNKLNDVVLPNSLSSIGNSSFSSCSALKSVRLPSGIKSIPMSAFNSCTSLETVTMADNVESVEDNAFYNCTSLKKVTLSKKCEKIGQSAFKNCTALQSIDLPSALTSIDYGAFENCNLLQNIVIPEGVTLIDAWTFGECSSLRSVTLPNQLQRIRGSAFKMCSSLTELEIPNTVTEIDDSAFERCTSLKSITIPNRVSLIDMFTFSGCSNLENVTIPKSVEKIDRFAFYNCKNLKNVYYAGTKSEWDIISISSDNECLRNATVNYLGKKVTYVGDYENIVSVKFGENAILPTPPEGYVYRFTVDGKEWDGKNVTSDIVVTVAKVQRVNATYTYQVINGDAVITGVSSKDDFTGAQIIPSELDGYTVTSIKYSAFLDCTGLTSIIVPDSVTSIGDSAFAGCTNLTNITIPDSVNNIGIGILYDTAYYNDKSNWWNRALCAGNHLICSDGNDFYGNYVVKMGTKTISAIAFHKGSLFGDDGVSLTGIVLPDSISNIEHAFNACVKLKDIYYIGTPEQWNLIGGNKQFTSVNIHYNVKQITYSGDYVGEEYVDYQGDANLPVPPAGYRYLFMCNGEIWDGKAVTNDAKVTVKKILLQKIYKYTLYDGKATITGIAEKNNFTGEQVIPNEVDGYPVICIGNLAFSKCTNLKNVIISEGITDIGSYAFSECSNLESITIPASIKNVGEFAFESCTNLRKVYIVDIAAWCGIEFAGSYANPMYYGKEIYIDEIESTYILIPSGVTKIGNYAFCGGIKLTGISLPDTVKSIGTGAFYGCSNLVDIKIPQKVTNIGDGAFSGCSSLVSLKLPEGIISIGSNMFANCSQLSKITIPNGVKSIGVCAFSNCGNLISIEFPNGISSIEKHAFENCKKLENVIIPGSVKNIGYEAFTYCVNLTDVVLSDGVISIDEGAFSDCKILNKIIIPGSVTNIGDSAFIDCVKLTKVYYIGTKEKWNEINGNKSFPADDVFYCRHIVYIGDYEGEEYAPYKGDATLPLPPNGYTYVFTANGEPWNGKNVTDNATVSVELKELIYTVTYVGAYEGTVEVSYGCDVKLPEKEGYTYTFMVDGKEWNGENIKDNIIVTVTEKINTYTITYVGAYEGIETVTYNCDVVLPTKEGYTFTFTVGGKEWNGKNVKTDVIVTVTEKINTYTVTYIGAFEGTETVSYNGNVILPIKEGYTYTFTVDGEEWNGKNIKANVTVKVTEKINTYTVTYVGAYEGAVIVYYNSDVSLPTKEGYTFTFTVDGREWNGKNIKDNVTVTVTEKINTYTVTFVGAYEGTETVDYNSDIILPTKEGYTLTFIVDGKLWNGKNIKSDVSVIVTEKINTYTVTFVGAYEGTEMVNYGCDVTLPIKEGYTFSFTVDGQEWDGKNIKDNIIVTVSEKINTYIVTYVGAYRGTEIVEYNQNVSLPFKTGYTYKFIVDGKEWSGKNIKSDVTVTVTEEINTYTVTYVGAFEDTVTVNYGDDVKLPMKEGYTYTFMVDGKEWDGKNIKSDVKVFVSEKINTYIITYTGAYNGTSVVEYNCDAALPTKEGYTYTFTVDGKEWNGKNIKANVTVNVTEKINTYIVTYVGAYNGVEKVNYNNDVVLPTRIGYTYTFTVDGREWNGKSIKGDVTVTVTEKINTYIVTYVGAYEGTAVVNYGENVSLPTPPDGYTYEYTANGSEWDGKNIIDNIVVVVKMVGDVAEIDIEYFRERAGLYNLKIDKNDISGEYYSSVYEDFNYAIKPQNSATCKFYNDPECTLEYTGGYDIQLKIGEKKIYYVKVISENKLKENIYSITVFRNLPTTLGVLKTTVDGETVTLLYNALIKGNPTLKTVFTETESGIECIFDKPSDDYVIMPERNTIIVSGLKSRTNYTIRLYADYGDCSISSNAVNVITQKTPSKECLIINSYGGYSSLRHGKDEDDWGIIEALPVNNERIEYTVNISVSADAIWEVFTDEDLTQKIDNNNLMLKTGKNFAYIKVTAEDGLHFGKYRFEIYRQTKTPDPVITLSNGMIEITGEGTIYYTTDKSKPNYLSKEYTEPFAATEGTVIMAMASSKAYDEYSNTVTYTVKFERDVRINLSLKITENDAFKFSLSSPNQIHGYLVLALYDAKGNMVNKKINKATGTSVTISGVNCQNAKRYKAFVIDKLTNLKPISNAVSGVIN